MKSRLLFLDIDGVLNNRQSMSTKFAEFGGDHFHDCFDPACIRALNRLVRLIDADVVLSSAWRILHDYPVTSGFLQSRGCEFELIDRTPGHFVVDAEGTDRHGKWSYRGEEIAKWIENNKDYRSYIIVDDSSDMGHLIDRLVHTSHMTGLLDIHVDRALKLLNMHKWSHDVRDCSYCWKKQHAHKCAFCGLVRTAAMGPDHPPAKGETHYFYHHIEPKWLREEPPCLTNEAVQPYKQGETRPMKIAISDICSTLKRWTIGSKVTDHVNFLELLEEAITAHDPSSDRFPGQYKIQMPVEVNAMVSCGIGKASKTVTDYHLLEYREGISKFLKREHAARTDHVACIVYTNEAYLADPDVEEKDRAKIEAEGADYWLVAVLATCSEAGPPVLSPYRLIHNIGGGNNEALEYTAEEIREKAAAAKAYHDMWNTVADEFYEADPVMTKHHFMAGFTVACNSLDELKALQEDPETLAKRGDHQGIMSIAQGEFGEKIADQFSKQLL